MVETGRPIRAGVLIGREPLNVPACWRHISQLAAGRGAVTERQVEHLEPDRRMEKG